MFTHVVRMMGTSLAMSELGFEAAAISSTVAVTGAVVLPLTTMIPVGGFIGFTGTGQAVQHLGATATFILGAFLPLLAIVLRIWLRKTEQGETAGEFAPVGAS